jgi:hypothetical protein
VPPNRVRSTAPAMVRRDSRRLTRSRGEFTTSCASNSRGRFARSRINRSTSTPGRHASAGHRPPMRQPYGANGTVVRSTPDITRFRPAAGSIRMCRCRVPVDDIRPVTRLPEGAFLPIRTRRANLPRMDRRSEERSRPLAANTFTRAHRSPRSLSSTDVAEESP